MLKKLQKTCRSRHRNDRSRCRNRRSRCRNDRSRSSEIPTIQRRIEAGSTFKAGWFELSDQLRLQSPAEQRENTKAAIAEVAAEAPLSNTANTPDRSEAASRHLQAEDLALRAVQAEFEVPLTRQVAHSSGVRFDAAFVQQGRLHIVEVRSYFVVPEAEKLRTSLYRIATAAKEMGGPRAVLVAVLVVEHSESTKAIRIHATEALRGLPLEAVLRVYSLGELRSSFGLSDGDP